MVDLDSMCKEIGIGEGSYDLWFSLPERELCVDTINPLDFDDDVGTMLDMLVYTKCLQVYTTAKDNYSDLLDFDFTQFNTDERIQRVECMIEECQAKGKHEEVGKDDCEGDEEKDDVSFNGDSSNMDSSESEVEISPKKKKKRIPPPNPPFRNRKRGRYSMLRVISNSPYQFLIIAFS